jgi:hypothetical protein
MEFRTGSAGGSPAHGDASHGCGRLPAIAESLMLWESTIAETARGAFPLAGWA